MSRVQTLIEVVADNASKGTYPCEIVSSVKGVIYPGTICNAPERIKVGEKIDTSKGLVLRGSTFIRKNCANCVLDEYQIFTEIVNNL